MSYRDDLPGDDQPYVDPKIERADWARRKIDVEAGWMGVVLARLATGTALTSELAAAAGVPSGRDYGRFIGMLERMGRAGNLRKTGKRRGAIHMNNVWQAVGQ